MILKHPVVILILLHYTKKTKIVLKKRQSSLKYFRAPSCATIEAKLSEANFWIPDFILAKSILL